MKLQLTYEAVLLTAAAIIFIEYLDPIPMIFMVGVVSMMFAYEFLTVLGIIKHDTIIRTLQ